MIVKEKYMMALNESTCGVQLIPTELSALLALDNSKLLFQSSPDFSKMLSCPAIGTIF